MTTRTYRIPCARSFLHLLILTSPNSLCGVVPADDRLLIILVMLGLNDPGPRDAVRIPTQLEHIRVGLLLHLHVHREAVGMATKHKEDHHIEISVGAN